MTTESSRIAPSWLALLFSVGCGALGGPSLDELNAVHPLPDPTVDATPPEAPFEPAQRRDVADADATFVHDRSEYVSSTVLPGDLDGDGRDDLLLVGIRPNPPDTVPCDLGCPGFAQAVVHVIYGASPMPGALVASATLESWHVNGLRYSAGAAGDVDGDGLADFLVSVGTEGCEQGSVFLVRGGPRMAGTLDVRDAGSLVRESGTCALLGEATGVGDLDGDGFGETVVAAPAEDRAYLFYGSDASPPPRRSELDAAAVFVRPSIGRAMPAGDVDGDGLDDLVFGDAVPDVLSEPTDHPQWLVLGRAERLSGELDPRALGTELVAARLARLGDVTGDGLDDLGATLATGTADGLVVAGRTEWPVALDVRSTTIALTRAAPTTVNEPAFMARAGDVNGDGAADFLYGEPSYDAGDGVPRGAVHLFLGPVLGPLDLAGSTTFLGQDWAGDLDGARRGFDRLGRSMGGGSDLDGDGYGDLVLPATDAPDGGRVYVWLGRPS